MNTNSHESWCDRQHHHARSPQKGRRDDTTPQRSRTKFSVITAAAGGALGAGAGAVDATWWKDEFGIPDDFVKQIGAMIQPGDSAIYALLRTANPDVVADQFRGYGGTILSTTLSRDQQKKVENVLSRKAA